MLSKLFGTDTLAHIFLNHYHYGEIYSGLVKKNTSIGSRSVLNQLNKMKEDLWKYVATELPKNDIDVILVGGPVVSIYSEAKTIT